MQIKEKAKPIGKPKGKTNRQNQKARNKCQRELIRAKSSSCIEFVKACSLAEQYASSILHDNHIMCEYSQQQR